MMKEFGYPVLVLLTALLAGCASRTASSPREGAVPYLEAPMTVAQADQALRKGMSHAEVAHAISAIPLMTMHSTSYILADGHITCRWENGKLKDWSLARKQETTEQEADGDAVNRAP